MEHDRITSLLSRTPAGIPEPGPDFDLLARRARGRRVRRSAGAGVVALVVAVGVALPLAGLFALRGGSHPVGTGGPTSPSETAPSSGAGPRTAVIDCTNAQTEVRTPQVEVWPDGVHIRTEGPTDAHLMLHLSPLGHSDQVVSFGVDDKVTVLPLAPGPWRAHCTDVEFDDVDTGPGWYDITFLDPNHLWTSDEVACSDTQETVALSNETVTSRDEVPGAIRAAVPGIRDADRIETARYPEGEQMDFRVVRDGSTVAVVRFLARDGLPSSDLVFDVTACPDAGFAAPSRSP
jgi:hypothetical protein